LTEWNQILRGEWYSREEPDEIVTELTTKLQKTNEKPRVLDLGCGAGRHVIYMACRGFEVCGADISSTGLDFTLKRLKKRQLEAYLVKCDMGNLPFASSCFDAAICLHTIYHQKLIGMERTASELRRVLKEKGLLLVNFLSKKTYRYGKGTKIEKDTFVNYDNAEKGVPHHFSSEEEIRALFKQFQIDSLKLSEKEVDGKLQSRWILMATS
jgi:ubiquinone/menaquinone biosynthesis C-methylase UbiE